MLMTYIMIGMCLIFAVEMVVYIMILIWGYMIRNDKTKAAKATCPKCQSSHLTEYCFIKPSSWICPYCGTKNKYQIQRELRKRHSTSGVR